MKLICVFYYSAEIHLGVTSASVHLGHNLIPILMSVRMLTSAARLVRMHVWVARVLMSLDHTDVNVKKEQFLTRLAGIALVRYSTFSLPFLHR